MWVIRNLFRLNKREACLLYSQARERFWQAACLLDERRAPILRTPGGLVKKRFELPFIAALAVLFVTVSLGSFAHAQQSAPEAQQPAPQSQPPDTPAPPPTASQPAQTESGQAPSQSTGQTPSPTQSSPTAAPADATGSKEYVGTIVKQGDKYMFQETATGTTYDIDHQDEVKKFDGKKVRVHGTMDTDGKTIHVQ
jgi:hypothetical protein